MPYARLCVLYIIGWRIPNLNLSLKELLGTGGLLMDKCQETISKKMTFTEFSESCRSKFAEAVHGTKDHEGNLLLDDPKVQQQLKLHKDALDR